MYVSMRTIPNLGLVVHVVEVATGDLLIGNTAGTVTKSCGERRSPLVAEQAVACGAIAGGVDQWIVSIR